MEEERINLSQRERDRLRVLHELEQGHLQQREAARRLRLSDRQIRRLQTRWRKEGNRGLIHRLRGRKSNGKISEDLQQRALRQLGRRCYAGFGPTLASEHLARQGILVSRETLRKWMSQAALWRRVYPIHAFARLNYQSAPLSPIAPLTIQLLYHSPKEFASILL